MSRESSHGINVHEIAKLIETKEEEIRKCVDAQIFEKAASLKEELNGLKFNIGQQEEDLERKREENGNSSIDEIAKLIEAKEEELKRFVNSQIYPWGWWCDSPRCNLVFHDRISWYWCES